MNYLFDGGDSTAINVGAGDGRKQVISEVIKAFKDAGHNVDYEMVPRREGDAVRHLLILLKQTMY